MFEPTEEAAVVVKCLYVTSVFIPYCQALSLALTLIYPFTFSPPFYLFVPLWLFTFLFFCLHTVRSLICLWLSVFRVSSVGPFRRTSTPPTPASTMAAASSTRLPATSASSAASRSASLWAWPWTVSAAPTSLHTQTKDTHKQRYKCKTKRAHIKCTSFTYLLLLNVEGHTGEKLLMILNDCIF